VRNSVLVAKGPGRARIAQRERATGTPTWAGGDKGMAIATDSYASLERKVGSHLRDDESHRRLTEALAEVAAAAIHPARHLGLGRSASRGMLEDPIESATQAAVESLIRDLEALVETLPRQTVDELVKEQVAAELGIE
jgi:hypothetical protein